MASRKSTACCCCSSNANSPGQRRVLHNPSSKHLIPLLKQLMARMYMEKEIDAVLPDCVESESDPTYYLCIQCFRALEKLIKARKDVEKLEEELAMKLEKVGVQCNLTRRVVQVDPTASHIPTNSQSNTPVKRLSSGSRPLEGRQSMETPVRDAVANVIAPTTPVVAVLEKHQRKYKIRRLSRSLKTFGRCVGRRNRSAIARQAIKDRIIRDKVIHLLGKGMSKELKATCSNKANSILKNSEPTTLESFTWTQLLANLSETAPMTVLLLKTLTSSCTKNPDVVICVCCAILLRARNQRMNLVQRLVSVILHGGHATKQVYTRLQRLSLCLSHKSTLSFVDKLGVRFDAAVKEWKDDITSRKLQANQLPIHTSSNATTTSDQLAVHPLVSMAPSSDQPSVPPPVSTTPSSDQLPVHPLVSTTSSSDQPPVHPPFSTTPSSDQLPVHPLVSTTLSSDQPPVHPPFSTTPSSDQLPVHPLVSTTPSSDQPPVHPPVSITSSSDQPPVPPPVSTTPSSDQPPANTDYKVSSESISLVCQTDPADQSRMDGTSRSSQTELTYTLHQSKDDSTSTTATAGSCSSMTTSSQLSIINEPQFSIKSVTFSAPSRGDLTVDLDTIYSPVISKIPTDSSPKTFKIVMDNIDKNIKPNQMRIDHQTRSLHYVHKYAVRDRIDLSSFEDRPSLPDVKCINVQSILPTQADHSVIRKNFSVLVARVLVQSFSFLKPFRNSLERHINHQFIAEMSQKSEIVPLGVTLKNENKYEEMVCVMDELQEYVPTISTSSTIEVDDDEEVDVILDDFHYILLGGDQLTVTRARGCKRIRRCGERGKDQLQGLLPVCEDWHAKVCLLDVVWRRLYSVGSAMDGSTMYQLRNLINRRNVVSSPHDGVSACEDFFITVIESHIIAAALNVFGMENVDSVPSLNYFPEGCVNFDSLKQRQLLTDAAYAIVEKFVNISCCKVDVQKLDHITEYAQTILSLGLLLMEFNDGIREGDGERIIRCWRYFLPIFKHEGRKNYAIEAFTLLVQHDFLFTPRMAAQLKWNRTVNTQGRTGKNVSCDLHMEHLNRELKTSLAGLGANVNDQTILRAGRSLQKHLRIIQQFDYINNVPTQSSKHSRKSKAKDTQRIIDQLVDTAVFKNEKGRTHKHFKGYQGILKNTDEVEFNTWMDQQLQKLLLHI